MKPISCFIILHGGPPSLKLWMAQHGAGVVDLSETTKGAKITKMKMDTMPGGLRLL
jgi:hypothetical protein